jgi:hypothetical protein
MDLLHALAKLARLAKPSPPEVLMLWPWKLRSSVSRRAWRDDEPRAGADEPRADEPCLLEVVWRRPPEVPPAGRSRAVPVEPPPDDSLPA